jgi:hypothetical protein
MSVTFKSKFEACGHNWIYWGENRCCFLAVERAGQGPAMVVEGDFKTVAHAVNDLIIREIVPAGFQPSGLATLPAAPVVTVAPAAPVDAQPQRVAL